MKFYQEKYFNSINWLLCNIKNLSLNSDETVVLSQIMLSHQYNESITMAQLADKSNMSKDDVDKVLHSLTNKGYLTITTNKMDLVFNIDNIYNKKNAIVENNNIYELFENELGKVLSQIEMVTISEWLQVYDYDTIVNALRESLINGKKSIKYIEKILANGNKKE